MIGMGCGIAARPPGNHCVLGDRTGSWHVFSNVWACPRAALGARSIKTMMSRGERGPEVLTVSRSRRVLQIPAEPSRQWSACLGSGLARHQPLAQTCLAQQPVAWTLGVRKDAPQIPRAIHRAWHLKVKLAWMFVFQTGPSRLSRVPACHP